PRPTCCSIRRPRPWHRRIRAIRARRPDPDDGPAVNAGAGALPGPRSSRQTSKTNENPCTARTGRARADEIRPARCGTAGSRLGVAGGGTTPEPSYDCDYVTTFTKPSQEQVACPCRAHHFPQGARTQTPFSKKISGPRSGGPNGSRCGGRGYAT